MPESDEHRPPSWWSTLPGILTGVAALITALAGLYFGLVQLNAQTAPTAAAKASSAAPVSPAPAEAGGAGPRATGSAGPSASTVPVSTSTVHVTNEPQRVADLEYTVLSGSTRPDAEGMIALELAVRCFNYGPYDANFWDASFRIAAGTETYAPTSGLDLLVASDSSRTGVVRFVLPASERSFTLTFRFPAGERSVPVSLS